MPFARVKAIFPRAMGERIGRDLQGTGDAKAAGRLLNNGGLFSDWRCGSGFAGRRKERFQLLDPIGNWDAGGPDRDRNTVTKRTIVAESDLTLGRLKHEAVRLI